MKLRDVKMLGAGALVSALALVTVYEGRVAVSHANQSAVVGAGERASVGADGVSVAGEDGRAIDGATRASSSLDEPLAAANKNLVEQVSGYRSRLEAMQAEKKTVEKRLSEAEKKLAAEENGGVPPKNEWEFSKDDWAEMAKNGEFKMRVPCMKKDGWLPDAEALSGLGLGPDDAETLRLASKKTTEHTWAQIRPLCAAELGSEAMADKLADMCGDIVRRRAKSDSKDAAKDAQRVVAEIRAGLLPMPGPNDKVDPVVGALLAESGALGFFENELAKSLGPAEAHRIAYDDALCAGHSHFASGPRLPARPGARR